ncbi:MAG TPA: ABC transporter ATP-binding protein [Firmicutes bacterium]|nr:ABC transporter ATP-binding protein [Bacillota bacterium]
MEGQDIIVIDGLTKDYGQGRGVFNVSFSVHKGECFGFLGPNGAGKSTTIRHLMGFAKPDSGKASINGIEASKNLKKAMEGTSYLMGEVALPKLLTGKQFLDEMAKLKGIKDFALRDYLVKYFDLDLSLLCKDMSTGGKRKLAVVSCFMSDPDVVVMDEPSSGLDPEMQEKFLFLIEEEKRRGKTMLLSSHIFSEVDACCDRIAIIKDGSIVSLFNSDDLKHKEDKSYSIKFSKKEDYVTFSKKKIKKWKIVDKDLKSKHVVISIKEGDVLSLLKEIEKYAIKDFSEIKETLEDYFMSFYKEEKTYVGL